MRLTPIVPFLLNAFRSRLHPSVALFCAAIASYQIVENRLLVKLGARAEWKAATTIWIDDNSDDVLLRES